MDPEETTTYGITITLPEGSALRSEVVEVEPGLWALTLYTETSIEGLREELTGVARTLNAYLQQSA